MAAARGPWSQRAAGPYKMTRRQAPPGDGRLWGSRKRRLASLCAELGKLAARRSTAMSIPMGKLRLEMARSSWRSSKQMPSWNQPYNKEVDRDNLMTVAIEAHKRGERTITVAYQVHRRARGSALDDLDRLLSATVAPGQRRAKRSVFRPARRPREK